MSRRSTTDGYTDVPVGTSSSSSSESMAVVVSDLENGRRGRDLHTGSNGNDNAGNSNDDNDFEHESGGENSGLMTRRRSYDGPRGTYESVRTNAYSPGSYSRHGDSSFASSSCLSPCYSLLCQTVMIVTSLFAIGTLGFLIGSTKPELLIATINATTGFDFNEYTVPPVVVAPGPVGSAGSDTIDNVTMLPDPAAASSSGVMCTNNTTPTNMNISNMNDTEIMMDIIVDKIEKKKKKSITVRYDPSIILANTNGRNDDNPFNNPPSSNNKKNNPFLIPSHPFDIDVSLSSSSSSLPPVGYMKGPHLVDNRLVFLSEGDAYVTRLSSSSSSLNDVNTILPSMKVTTTVGNIIDPKWHPTLPILAYTATYSGRRDVYLLDLSPTRTQYLGTSTPIRVTYWDVGPSGVNGLIGWVKVKKSTSTASTTNKNDKKDNHANCLVFRATSNDVSLPDQRLYMIHLGTTATSEEEVGEETAATSTTENALSSHSNSDDDSGNHRRLNNDNDNDESSSSNSASATLMMKSVLEIEPIPLSQAIDAAFYNSCWYFVRVKQSSHTIRYVGGTAENLWLYCDNHNNNDTTTMSSSSSSSSQPLFVDDGYKGTSKSPQLYQHNEHHYLLFLSDRGRNIDSTHPTWIPDRMNIWALRLQVQLQDDNTDTDTKNTKYSYSTKDLIQVTDTSCDFEGRTIQEYSVDSVTGNIIVRIGADFYMMNHKDVQAKIVNNDTNTKNNSNSIESDNDTKNKSKNKNKNKNKNTSGDGSRFLEEEENEEDKKEQEPPQNTERENGKNKIDNDKENDITNSLQVSPDIEDDDGNDNDAHSKDNDDDESTVAEFHNNNNNDDDDDDDDENDDDTDTDNDGYDNKNVTNAENFHQSENPTQSISTVTVESLEKDDTIGIDITNLDDDDNGTNTSNSTKPPAKYYYDYQPLELVSRSAVNAGDDGDHYSGRSTELKRLPIAIYSDFQNEQERIIPVDIVKQFKYGDVYETITGSIQMLLTLRGQVWVAPVVDDDLPKYKDAGMNMPARRYRLAPGATMGGVTRILASIHVPNPVEDDKSDRRLAVILATDPLTSTAEHAFYLIETQPGASPLFVDVDRMPKPFLGGIVSGGSTKDGGLGSVKPDTIAMSPCGNRMAWSDTDGRIVVMNLPQYQELEQKDIKCVVLPKKNELDEPMVGDDVDLVLSPGGRYLAIQHNAQNQFTVISIVDLGDPLGNEEENKIADIALGRIVQATPSKFNSNSPYWGKSPTDVHNLAQNKTMAKLFSVDEPDDVSATMLYFLSDRDIKTDVTSPWGTRQRMPHFDIKYGVYALPLQPKDIEPVTKNPQAGQFRGGGVEELHVETLLERMALIQALLDKKSATSTERRERRSLAESLHPLAGAFGYAEKAFVKKQNRRIEADDNVESKDTSTDDDNETADTNDHLEEAVFPKDMDIDFGPTDLTFARRAYQLSTIPENTYSNILCQNPDGTFVLVNGSQLDVFEAKGYPSDKYEKKTFKAKTRSLMNYGLSASRKFIYLVYSPDGAIRVVPNSNQGMTDLLSDDVLDKMVVDKKGMHLSVWPALEHRQMFDDAWRMLRDYFYDPNMTGIDWYAIHHRYLPLVERCKKREELDDVLSQMASELSALHVFVYGGEYNSPIHNNDDLLYVNEIGSLGASLVRTPAWKGYTITNIPEADPDFTTIDQSSQIYSPLSDQSLRLSGQRGLEIGDVIVGVNGESVMSVPEIHLLLQGTSGTSIRLDILRLKSAKLITEEVIFEMNKDDDKNEATVESLITVPISPNTNGDLLYNAWEWKTQKLAEELAEEAGISVGYVHLKSMSGMEAEDAFARGFFPNYKKQGFILDLRHNLGGNIDSWVLDVFQRRAWMYWQSRDFDASNGGLDWDMQFAFRGHVIVLVDEKTSSDGEGVSRGMKELGLGKVVGTRTWGGGIWLASDNHLVDGGIATAPEIGTYNEHIGWGLGIEQMGLDPDIVIDNDPHETYNGRDQQLERAIEELKKWIEEEPVVIPKPKGKRKDMTMGDRECKAS